MKPSIRRKSSTSLTFRFIFRRELPENTTIFHIIRKRNIPETRNVRPVVRHQGSLIITITFTGGVVHLPGYIEACTSTTYFPGFRPNSGRCRIPYLSTNPLEL